MLLQLVAVSNPLWKSNLDFSSCPSLSQTHFEGRNIRPNLWRLVFKAKMISHLWRRGLEYLCSRARRVCLLSNVPMLDQVLPKSPCTPGFVPRIIPAAQLSLGRDSKPGLPLGCPLSLSHSTHLGLWVCPSACYSTSTHPSLHATALSSSL